jgi:hypothetical protein
MLNSLKFLVANSSAIVMVAVFLIASGWSRECGDATVIEELGAWSLQRREFELGRCDEEGSL